MLLNAVVIVLVLVLSLAIVLTLIDRRARRPVAIKGRHALISGGSEGIGKALALKMAAEGASRITLLARNTDKLEAAASEIRAKHPYCTVIALPADVSNFNAVSTAVELASNSQGIDIAVNCAGFCTPGYFLEQDPSVFAKHMNVNYLGTVHLAKAVSPGMAKRKTGSLVFVSSGICAAPFIGYSAYAPSKVAVRGLADALRNELQGTGVSVHICFPPDTLTEGFESENKTKPAETLRIVPPVHSYSAMDVAGRIINDLKAGYYVLSAPDSDVNFGIALNNGAAPRASTCLDALLAPILVIYTQFWRLSADKLALSYTGDSRACANKVR
jgi:3-dehydrosphinganine reductase